MIHKTIIAAPLAAALALAGCAPAGGLSPALQTSVNTVQGIVATLCHFIPLAEQIAAILSKSPAVPLQQVAAAVCTAIGAPPPASSRLRGPLSSTLTVSPGVVDGVVISGGTHF